MQENELAALAAQMAVLMEKSRRREDSLDQRQDALAQQLSALFAEKTDDCLRTVSGQASSAVREKLGPSMDDCQRRIQGMATEAGQATLVLKGATADAASQRRVMWWGMAAVVLVCLVSLAVNYHMLYGHYRQQYDQLLTAVPYMDAVNRSDVVPCGDKQLCARIDIKAPRVGDKKQYRVVAPRQ